MKQGACRALAVASATTALITGVTGYVAGRSSGSALDPSGGEGNRSIPTSIAVDRTVAGPLIGAIRTAAEVEAVLARIALPERKSEQGKSDYCVVVATAGGLPLLRRHDGRRLRIASVTKLYTTTAAVLALGADYRFETKLVVSEPSGNGSPEVEAAYLVGAGDPYLVSSEFEGFWRRETGGGPVTRLEELADEVAGSGIRRIGTLYADPSLFDAQRFPPGMPTPLIEQRLLPPVSALSVDRNLVEWRDGIETAEFTSDPAGTAGSKLAAALRRRGVSVGRTAGGTAGGGERSGRRFVVRSQPLRRLVSFINGRSDNFAAEMLAKRIAASGGSEGSWKTFWAQAAEILKRNGIDVSNTQLDDGSGLSGNHSSCGDVTSLLVGLNRLPGGSVISESLPSPGSPGTLEDRYTGIPGAGRLRAKTGSLRDVSVLAGVVDTENLSAVLFTVLVNGSEATESRSEVEEPVVRALIASTN